MSVVTRFAPSPTGYLHIGGARTALFNWLYARRMAGQYLLRIEDTDRARSTPEAIEAIFNGLSWLGITGDEPAVFQFERAPRHREIANAMVDRGTAFRCYATTEEVEKARNEAMAAGFAFRSPYRDGKTPPTPSAPFVVRLRAPDRDIVNHDLVQGDVTIAGKEIDDLVLLRSDETPTYMLSVVVDDHDMGVTHVIRGDDHLTNAARQIPIFEGMGWSAPRFAHIPLIHDADGRKLGKRIGSAAVTDYRDMGYLPEGMASYLMRLGWSPGHDDILSKEEAIPQFDIAQIGKAPARLDFDKLNSVNAHFMKLADGARMTDLLLDFIAKQKQWPLTPAARERVIKAAPMLKNRAKTLADLADQLQFLIAERPLALDAKAAVAIKDFQERLRRLHDRLRAELSWESAALGAALKAFATDEGVGMGQIGPGLRAALTGGLPAPDLGVTLEVLGHEEALARIADQI